MQKKINKILFQSTKLFKRQERFLFRHYTVLLLIKHFLYVTKFLWAGDVARMGDTEVYRGLWRGSLRKRDKLENLVGDGVILK